MTRLDLLNKQSRLEQEELELLSKLENLKKEKDILSKKISHQLSIFEEYMDNMSNVLVKTFNVKDVDVFYSSFRIFKDSIQDLVDFDEFHNTLHIIGKELIFGDTVGSVVETNTNSVDLQNIISDTNIIIDTNVTSDTDNTNVTSDTDNTNVTSDTDNTNVTSDTDNTNVTSDTDNTNVTSDTDNTNVTSDTDNTNDVINGVNDISDVDNVNDTISSVDEVNNSELDDLDNIGSATLDILGDIGNINTNVSTNIPIVENGEVIGSISNDMLKSLIQDSQIDITNDVPSMDMTPTIKGVGDSDTKVVDSVVDNISNVKVGVHNSAHSTLDSAHTDFKTIDSGREFKCLQVNDKELTNDDILNGIFYKYKKLFNSSSLDATISLLTAMAHDEKLFDVNSEICHDIEYIYNSNKDYYAKLINTAYNIQVSYVKHLFTLFDDKLSYDFTSNQMSTVRTWFSSNASEFMTEFSKLSYIERILVLSKLAIKTGAKLNSNFLMYELPLDSIHFDIPTDFVIKLSNNIKSIPLMLSVYISAFTEYSEESNKNITKISMVDITHSKLDIFNIKSKLGLIIGDMDIPFEREFRCFEYYDAPYIQYIISTLILNQ